MKKETVIAIFFGIFFGAIIAVFIVIKNKDMQLQKNKSIVPNVETNSKVTQNSLNSTLLEVSFPTTDGMIVQKNSITITGKTEKDTLVMVQSPTKDIVVNTTKPEFSIPFPLSLGENIIRVSAYAKRPQLRVQEKELKVYYLPEL